MTKTALIAGATGLVGDDLLRQMLAHDRYDRVIALSRRAIALSHPKFENIITDFAKLETLRDIRADDVFCCLGTTMATALAVVGAAQGTQARRRGCEEVVSYTRIFDST